MAAVAAAIALTAASVAAGATGLPPSAGSGHSVLTGGIGGMPESPRQPSTALPSGTQITPSAPTTMVASPTATTTVAPPAASITTTAAAPQVIAADCSVDVSTPLNAYLASLPSGAVFSAPPGACFLVNNGIEIDHPLTFRGATLRDNSTTGLTSCREVCTGGSGRSSRSATRRT